jgi:hypothetical protein
MPLKQFIDPIHLARGLRSPGTVEMVFDSQNIRDPLGDFGWKASPLSLWIVQGSPNLGIISPLGPFQRNRRKLLPIH